MSTKLNGVYAAVVTPYDENGDLDLAQQANCFQHLASRGCDGVLLCGTTGEGPSLSVTERAAMFEAAAAAKGSLRLLAGTGAASLKDTIKITEHAYNAGMDATVIIPPFFYKQADDEGLFDFFAEVIRQAVPTDGQVFLYHNPVASCMSISLDLMERLIDAFPTQVTGIKDSSTDIDHIRAILARFPHLAVFTGDDRTLSDTLAAGGVGLVSLVNNMFPDLSRAVYDAHTSGEDTQAAQARLTGTHGQLDGLPRIAAVKYLMWASGILSNAAVRPPLRGLTEEEESTLKKRFMLDMEIPKQVSLKDLADLNSES